MIGHLPDGTDRLCLWPPAGVVDFVNLLLQPVFAAVLGWVLLGQAMGGQQLLGASVVLGALASPIDRAVPNNFVPLAKRGNVCADGGSQRTQRHGDADRRPERRRLPVLLRRAWYGLNQAFRQRIARMGLTPTSSPLSARCLRLSGWAHPKGARRCDEQRPQHHRLSTREDGGQRSGATSPRRIGVPTGWTCWP